MILQHIQSKINIFNYTDIFTNVEFAFYKYGLTPYGVYKIINLKDIYNIFILIFIFLILNVINNFNILLLLLLYILSPNTYFIYISSYTY